jgi:uncharacterized repeat protein (TIGR03803 family)
MKSSGFGKIACLIASFCVATALSSAAQTFTSLLSFDGKNGANPNSSLVQGLDGAMYGATYAVTTGEIFRITPEGTLGVLNSSLMGPSGLVLANNGNFYGTTIDYAMETCGTVGRESCGTVFRLSPKGALTTLFTFNPPSEGAGPSALVQGIDGNLYGTTKFGGAVPCKPWVGCGTVFKITATGEMTTLYSFCSRTNCADGSFPTGLVQGADGAFYGTTHQNGETESPIGTVFRITAAGKLTTIYNFCSLPSCADGFQPYGPLALGSDGNLYGTTVTGGTLNGGTVFKITPAGALTTLYRFCSATGCSDGLVPNAGLVQATDGNFYGTTNEGGDYNICNHLGCGTIFEITPAGVLTTLHVFVNTDGALPSAGLLQRTDGAFYGTTQSGGNNGCLGCGTVFKLTTGLGPFVRLTRESGKAGQSGGILGQGFTGTTGVFLNGAPASFTVISDTLIRATVPAGATTGLVTVQTPAGNLTSNVPFQVKP